MRDEENELYSFCSFFYFYSKVRNKLHYEKQLGVWDLYVSIFINYTTCRILVWNRWHSSNQERTRMSVEKTSGTFPRI